MDAVNPSVRVQWGGREVSLLVDDNALIEYRDTFGVSLEADFSELMQTTVHLAKYRETGEGDIDPAKHGITRIKELLTRFLWAGFLHWSDPVEYLRPLCDGLTPPTLRQIRRDMPAVGTEQYQALNEAVLRAVQKAFGVKPPEPGEERPTTAAKNGTPQSKRSTGTKHGGLRAVASS